MKINTESPDKIEISVVMPCLNEAETVVGCIQEALAALAKNNISGEVLIADNGSTDSSRQLAEDAGARVVRVEEKGYGNALKGGISAARGKYVIMGDADGSYDFGELPRYLTLLREGHDLVMGCRLPKGGGVIEDGAMPWKHRWIGNPVLSALGRLFFKVPVDDFHCGLRGFNKESILSLELKTGGMEFASEMVVKASLGNLKITQIPITLRQDKRSGKPHLRSWRDGWRHLRFMLLYSPGWLFALPGVFFAMLGLCGFFFLLPDSLTVGGVTFGLNSLLTSGVTLTLGYQAIIFAIFVKTYSVNRGLLPGPKPYVVGLLKGRAAEYGLLIGLAFIVFGASGIAWMVMEWKDAGFGELPLQESLRTTISSVTAITLGIQTIFSGFVLSVLDIEY